MAINKEGYRPGAPGAGLIITGEGLLQGFMASHASTSPQTLTFYDNTTATGTVLAVIRIAPEQCPYYVMFPRRHAIPFTTGLSADYTGIDLIIWAVNFD